MRQGLKAAGQGGSVGEARSSLEGPCWRAQLCPLQIRMAPAEVPPLDQVDCEL